MIHSCLPLRIDGAGLRDNFLQAAHEKYIHALRDSTSDRFPCGHDKCILDESDLTSLLF